MFDVADRLLVILVCLSILTVCFLIMVCKLSPWCWLHDYCPLRAEFPEYKKHKFAEDGYISAHSKDSPVLETLLWSPVSKADTGSILSGQEGHETSPLATDDGRLSRDYDSLGVTKSPSDDSASDSGTSLPSLQNIEVDASVAWKKKSRKLQIRVGQVRNLSDSDVRARKQMCLKLQLLRITPTSRKSLEMTQEEIVQNTMYEVQTRAKKNARQMNFDENFSIVIPEGHLSNYCLRFVSCEMDRHMQLDNTGEAKLLLRDIELDQENLLTIPLQLLPKGKQGELLFSLMYLPTAEKLSVTLIECRELKYLRAIQDSDLQIRVSVLRSGSICEKKRSASHRAGADVTFNETHVFDIPQKVVRDVCILFSVRQTTNLSAVKETREVVLGRTSVGLQVESGSAREHWSDMLNNARKQILRWHTLY